jgi:protein-tyrosine-phosphatase
MTEAQRPAAFITRPPEKVLFLCIHNSTRSQIAEGFARSMAPASAVVFSAGSEPRSVHPRAVEVMTEVGIDIAGHTSKSLDDVPWSEVDTVVTLCDEGAQACPSVAGDVRRVQWHLPDPSGVPEARQFDAFRELRDEIRWRVASLWPRGD